MKRTGERIGAIILIATIVAGLVAVIMTVGTKAFFLFDSFDDGLESFDDQGDDDEP